MFYVKQPAQIICTEALEYLSSATPQLRSNM